MTDRTRIAAVVEELFGRPIEEPASQPIRPESVAPESVAPAESGPFITERRFTSNKTAARISLGTEMSIPVQNVSLSESQEYVREPCDGEPDIWHASGRPEVCGVFTVTEAEDIIERLWSDEIKLVVFYADGGDAKTFNYIVRTTTCKIESKRGAEIQFKGYRV